MSGLLNLNPRSVYFLKLVDDAGRHVFPFVKVGITDGPIEARIDQLQTGNPFRLVAHDHFRSEAAEVVERHIHRVHSDRRVRLEWLRFEDSELDDLVWQARAFNDGVSSKAGEVRVFDAMPSNQIIIPLTADVEALTVDMWEILSRLVEVTNRQEVAKIQLKNLVGTAGGIDGVVEVLVTKPSRRFSVSEFKKAHEALHQEYCRLESLGCSFSFSGKPRINAFPDVHADLKQAKSEVVRIEAAEVEGAKILVRSDDIAACHQAYLELEKEKSEVEADLLQYELELRHRCGENEGIKGVCTYKRAVSHKFDAEAFEAEHPDLWKQFQLVGQPQRRVTILKTRAYA